MKDLLGINKTCPKCGEEKDLSQFARDNTGRRKDGHRTRCMKCAAKDLSMWLNKKTLEERKRYRTYSKLRSSYGISPIEYEMMRLTQNNCCSICEKEFSEGHPPCVDHNHQTGCVRGLLCHPCNQAIGLLEEDEARVIRALTYLMSHRTFPFK